MVTSQSFLHRNVVPYWWNLHRSWRVHLSAWFSASQSAACSCSWWVTTVLSCRATSLFTNSILPASHERSLWYTRTVVLKHWHTISLTHSVQELHQMPDCQPSLELGIRQAMGRPEGKIHLPEQRHHCTRPWISSPQEVTVTLSYKFIWVGNSPGPCTHSHSGINHLRPSYQWSSESANSKSLVVPRLMLIKGKAWGHMPRGSSALLINCLYINWSHMGLSLKACLWGIQQHRWSEH